MKSGFVTVLEELAKIQFDERKQKEWLEKASQYEAQIAQLTDTVESLKVPTSESLGGSKYNILALLIYYEPFFLN